MHKCGFTNAFITRIRTYFKHTAKIHLINIGEDLCLSRFSIPVNIYSV